MDGTSQVNNLGTKLHLKQGKHIHTFKGFNYVVFSKQGWNQNVNQNVKQREWRNETLWNFTGQRQARRTSAPETLWTLAQHEEHRRSMSLVSGCDSFELHLVWQWHVFVHIILIILTSFILSQATMKLPDLNVIHFYDAFLITSAITRICQV